MTEPRRVVTVKPIYVDRHALNTAEALMRYDGTLRQIRESRADGFIDFHDVAYLVRAATRAVEDRLIFVEFERAEEVE